MTQLHQKFTRQQFCIGSEFREQTDFSNISQCTYIYII